MATRNRRVNSMLRRTDNLTPNERRKAMRAVKGHDTAPERRVASVLGALKIRFRRQGSDLPGKPDYVLPTLHAVLLVQGCFWHSHGCRAKMPRTNRAYWLRKLALNVRRDQRVRRALNRQGWAVVSLWECQVPTLQRAFVEVARALGRARRSAHSRGRPRRASRARDRTPRASS